MGPAILSSSDGSLDHPMSSPGDFFDPPFGHVDPSLLSLGDVTSASDDSFLVAPPGMLDFTQFFL